MWHLTLILLCLLQLMFAKTQERIQPRVFGGEERTIQSLGGYAVQIYQSNKLVCTGSLLTERCVLTSAHCFEGSDYRKFHVVAGETQQINYFHSENIKNKVSKVIIHPDFDKFKFRADIAVFRVMVPIKGRNIGYLPICTVKLFPRDMVTVAGWGKSDVAQENNPLRTMRVPLVSKPECNAKLGRVMPINVVCAAGYNKRTICNGDSGGPMIFMGEVCGVSTWTYECGNDVKPDVYMSVYYYRDFIINAVAQLRH